MKFLDRIEIQINPPHMWNMVVNIKCHKCREHEHVKMDETQKELFLYDVETLNIKDEPNFDLDFEIHTQSAHQDSDSDYKVHKPARKKKTKMKNAKVGRSHKQRHLKKIAFGDRKRKLARIIQKYPFIWDKSNKYYRSKQKREDTWIQIANELKTHVLDVKCLWKKLKDTHRYFSSKAKKNNKSNPLESDFQGSEHNIMEDLAFLNNKNSRSNSDVISTSRNDSSFQKIICNLDTDDSCFGKNPDSSTTQNNNAMRDIDLNDEEPTAVNQITYSRFKENFDGQCDDHRLKHNHIWVQLEKLFEKLDDEKITDLNFLFVSETYKAVLQKRRDQSN